MANKQYVVATDTVISYPNGIRRIVTRGTLYDKTDPVVKAAGCFVSPQEWARMQGDLEVEQATAGPGEARNVKAPKKTG